MALAFIAADFMFYDKTNRYIEPPSILRVHKQGTIHMVHIRFRFDKSATNFSI
jgi:hypothetical protein